MKIEKDCIIALLQACFISETVEEMEQAFKVIEEQKGITATCEAVEQLLIASVIILRKNSKK